MNFIENFLMNTANHENLDLSGVLGGGQKLD